MNIEDMLINQAGFCVPWAFCVLPDGTYGVSKKQAVELLSNSNSKSMKLFIRRLQDGFFLDFSLCKEEYHSVPLYPGVNPENYLPVTSVFVPEPDENE